MHNNIKILTAAAAVIMLGLGGCSDALVFAERTSFSLASVNLNDSVAEPITVNIGFRRTVVAFAPATGDSIEIKKGGKTKTIADGEAVSMFSGFTLGYDDTSGGFTDTLTIRTQFASGVAAIQLADDKDAVVKIMQTDLVLPANVVVHARRIKLSRAC